MSPRACLYVALVLLQGADVVLTWRLLTTRPEVQEANPVALAVLERHGWAGAVALKLACTAAALGCVLAIGRARPVLSQCLLGGMCSLMLGVVTYSVVLLARPEDPDSLQIAASRRLTDSLNQELSSLNELMGTRRSLCADLLERRLDLPEAVRRMAGDLHRLSSRLTPRTRRCLPACGRPEAVARYLVGHCNPTPAQGGDGAMAPLREQLALHYPSATVGMRPDAALAQAAVADRK